MGYGNETLALPRDDEFHVYMRDWVIAITFFTVLYIFSHFIIRAFAKKIKDESDRVYLSMFLCTVCLTIALAAMLLLPITIVSNEIIYNFPNSYYTQWLHRELVFALWNKIFWSANIALFMILPFSHFFYQAEGLGGQGQLARIYEALAVLSLVCVMFAGFVYLVRGLLGEEDKVGYLAFSYSIISSFGAVLVLLSTPRGFTTLTTFGMWLYVPVVSRSFMNSKLYSLDLEEQVITEKAQERGFESTSEVEELKTVRAARASFKNSTLHPIFRNIVSIVVTVLNLAFTGYLVLRVFIHLLRQFFSPLFGDPTASELADFLALQDDAKAYRLGSFASLLQILVIIYMMMSAFVGFYYLPLTTWIRPKLRGLSMNRLTLNVACVLLISSSFPVVARSLEITSFDLLGDYSNTTYLRSKQFLIGYKFVFLVALTHRYVTFFNNSLHDLVVNFMSPILVKIKARFRFFSNSLHNLVVNFISPILVKFKARFGYFNNNTGLLDIFNPKPKND